ncbi:MAG: NTP/NDP exchange transporter [Steroidobacteraceae bacterium]
MSERRHLGRFERLLTLCTTVQPGEGRCIALLFLQAFSLMVAWYLIRPVREALILTEGDAELRSYAVGAQALLLIGLVPLYGLMIRNVAASRVFQRVILFFAFNLLLFFLLGLAGHKFGVVFFVWASIFAVMAVAQFWAFASDLLNVSTGKRLFGVIAVGISAGGWVGSRIASAAFEPFGPYGLMLASAAVLCGSVSLSRLAQHSVPPAARSPAAAMGESGEVRAGHWLSGFALIGRSRYLVGIAALVTLLNWISSTGDYVFSNWLSEIAGQQAPEARAGFIGRFMGGFCSTITLVGLLIQLLLVSRIIQLAGIARALAVTPIAFVAGYLLVGFVPVFALLQSVLVVQKSLDYSLLNTTRSALLLPASREEKYQAKTAIDTVFFRLGDLLSTLSVFIGSRLLADNRLQYVWLILVLSAAMTLVAWLIGREYARRYDASRAPSLSGLPQHAGPAAVLVQ